MVNYLLLALMHRLVSPHASAPRLLSARTTLYVAVVFGLAVLVGLPLLVVGVATVRPAGVLPFEPGGFSAENVRAVLDVTRAGSIVANTLIYSLGSLGLGMAIALLMAFLTERTDLPGRSFVGVLMIVSFALPAFATALGWILLTGRQGLANVALRTLLGADPSFAPVKIFSMSGMIFVTGLTLVSGMWILLSSVMRNMDPSLEEAALTAGMRPSQVAFRVTIPLLLPGIAAVALFFGIIALETFDIPLFIGMSAGIEVLSTRIFLLAQGGREVGGINYGLAASFGLISLILGVVGMMLYMRVVRHGEKYAVITGRGYRPRTIPLGWWKWPAVAVVSLYFLATVILPALILIYASGLRFYQPPLPGNFGSIVWTSQNYELLLSYRFFGRDLVNTAIVAVAAATVVMIGTTVLSWIFVRLRHQLQPLAQTLSFLPHTIPGVVLSLALLLLYLPTPVYGTLVFLVLAFTTRYLALGVRLMHSAQLQLAPELEEAALAHGMGKIRMLWHINLGLLKAAFLNGWALVAILVARDVTMPMMLATADTSMLGSLIFNRYHAGSLPQAAAPIVVLMGIATLLALVARRGLLRGGMR